MKLSKEQVEHIAHLARMGITEQEKELFSQQLSSVLEYVEQLQEVDTSSVEPTSQVTGLENVMRDDAIEQIDSTTREALLNAAPERDGELVKAKSVFEKKS